MRVAVAVPVEELRVLVVLVEEVPVLRPVMRPG